MDIAKIVVVYRKEVTDLLRDRKTVVSMVLFPLIIFPLMTVGVGTMQYKMRQKAQAQGWKVMVLGGEHGRELAQAIEMTEGIEVVAPSADFTAGINDKTLRAAVEIPAGFEAALGAGGGEPPAVKIHYYATEMRSEGAATRLEETLRQYRVTVIERTVAARGMTPEMLRPVTAERENVAEAQRVGGERLGALLPYFIVLLCVIGALGPAIDLTAGEKERGTMETILASGIERGDLVIGKFLTVLSGSLTTTALSIGSFAVTVTVAKGYMEELTRGQGYAISPASVLLVLVLILPLAILFSALMMTATLFAKSFKEGQTQGSIIMFVAIIAAMVGILPGVELNPTLAWIPVVNVSLAMKEILTGSQPWGMMALVFLSSSIYAAVALKIATQTFQRESVLFRV